MQIKPSCISQNPCSSNPCPAIHRCQTGFGSKGYRCVCSNGLFGRNCTEAPPSVQVLPGFIETEEGKEVFMMCNIISTPPPHLVKWSRSQESLPSQRSIVRGVNLTLENTTKQDSGSYVCAATNIWGAKSSSTKLKVYSALKFIVKPPLNVTVKADEVLSLPCSAESDLTPTMSWMYNGTVSLPPDARIGSSNNLIVSSANFTHGGTYTCSATNSLNFIQTNVTVYVKYPETCAKVKTDISDVSGDYVIDPDGVLGEDPFPVYCNMTDKRGIGVTIISHDSEDRLHVNGRESHGGYRRDIQYYDSSLSQIKGLIETSNSCQQFIKYECYNAAMRLGRISWWVSRDGDKKTYWGGASEGCACNVTNTCPTQEWPCNCDANDEEWREDSGFLTIKSDLPVIQLRFGDTGAINEEGYHTLGKLKCY